MPLSLVIFENPSEEEAYPLLATRDPAIIAIVRRLLMDRLAEKPTGTVLRLPREQTLHNQWQGQQGEANP
jgi:hypothetical protein